MKLAQAHLRRQAHQRRGRLNSALATCLYALAFATKAMAEAIKLEDVKVGAIVTREGIDLGGIFSHTIFPIPDGEWTVLSMRAGQGKFEGHLDSTRFVWLVLANRNNQAAIPIFSVQFNSNAKGIEYKFSGCGKSRIQLVNDFDSKEVDRLQRCALGGTFKNFDRDYALRLAVTTEKTTDSSFNELMRVIADQNEVFISNLSSTFVNFTMSYQGRYFLTSTFNIKPTNPKDSNSLIRGTPFHADVAQWVQNYGEVAADFMVGNGIVVLPNYPLPKKATTGSSAPQ